MKDYDEILIALRRIMRAADLHSKELFRAAGLTVPQLLVMQAIEKEGRPATSTLARYIVVSQATVTRIIDRLQESGLVTREKASKDKRVINISLTESGRERLAAAPEPMQTKFIRRYRRLEGWEQHMIKAALLRVAQMMDAEELDVAAVLQSGDILEQQPAEG